MKQMEVDALLRPYLEAESEAEAQLLLATLLSEQVEPLVQSIVARKLGFSSRLQQEETADVRGEIILQLLHRLQAMRRDPSTPPIENLKAYTVVTSFRGCAAYLRRRYPRRAQLLNRVQYVLTRYPQFGLWQKEGDWWSGMAHWVNDLQTRQLLSEFQLDQLLSPALPPSLYGVPDATLRRVSAPDQVAAIFHWAERFVTLDDLVLILAHWWEVKDSSLASEQITAQAEPAFLRPET
ncbi:MAG TPA: hypothetical protein VFZ34_12285, partial [Blastocatellia bacterium]|nr:hypothetical protein [Blastocatellia bacterium]